MTAPIVKYAEAPKLRRQDPTCEACCVDVESDGDGYVCPTCGTFWPYDFDEDEPGELYEEWTGEDIDLPVSDPEESWRLTINADRKAREARVAALIAWSTARRTEGEATA